MNALPTHELRTLGVTGGIGSGKTTVCRMLENLGARVFYADLEAKRLMQDDTQTRAALVAAFGPETFDAEGRLDRARLAARVFGDEDELARLNGIVHPRVFRAFGAARAQAASDGVRLLVKEAALIFEVGGERHLDAVAVVAAPLDARIARVQTRDQSTPEQIKARMRHQLPQDELRRRADYVIENDGDLERLRRQVERLYATVTRQADFPPKS